MFHLPPTLLLLRNWFIFPFRFYFLFLISLLSFFYSLLHNFITFPPHSWIPCFSKILSFSLLLHHISFVFPPPPPPPHFLLIPSSSSAFLLFSLHHHHHISTDFHSYCFPARKVIWGWPFRPDFAYFGGGGGGKTIEMWWRWWWWRENNRKVKVVEEEDGKW